MATLIQQPSALCFSSVIEDVVFGTQDTTSHLLLSVEWAGGSAVVLDETVYKSLNDTVSLVDLSSLIEVYARQHLEVRMSCSLTDSMGTISIDPVTVLYSMADVGSSAVWFTENHFLTIMDGEKLTAMGRDERLYAYGAMEVSVLADVRLDSGEFGTRRCVMGASGTIGAVSQFDVSPSRVIELLNASVPSVPFKVLSYTVEAGTRRQHFVMVEDKTPPAPSLVFTNSFGCQEFMHCVGTHAKDSKYTRTSARVRGRLRNFRVVEDRQFKANTGWLNMAMADWADDLLRSTEVFLWVNGMVGREIFITDSKSDMSNEDDDMPAFEFTYSYAQRIHNVMQPRHAGRVFDNTFDHTFN